MSLGCDNGRSAKNHLVDHELAVVFTDCSSGLFESRIRQICRIRPLPAKPPTKFLIGRLPFRLCGQPFFAPLRKSCCLVVRDVAYRSIERQFAQTAEREMNPLAIAMMPVKGSFYRILVHPIPAF